MKEPEDGVESAYRFLVADAFPFGRNARVQLEHGGTDESAEHYRTVAFWYGLPGACLARTDHVDVGDPHDEAAHGYASPTASAVETITSRYEWGVDHIDGHEVFPETSETGRHATGPSELTLAIQPDNAGVLLRRTLDYAIADQRAEVWIAGTSPGDTTFERAGVWFLAGSNRCLFSFPGPETGEATPILQVSNRRFRDDEFIVPARLTRGRSRLRVRLVPAPVPHPALPGATEPSPGAWSELAYDAYVWRLPPAP
jgi:hypothetical protein